MIGRILAGRYKITGIIGEGGMSRVWRAQDLNTGKAVAVKVLREEYHDDEIFVRRFEREAQAASRMTHPNIANLLDVGLEEDGTRYLVIEYVSGKTLKQFIQESGAIRPETAAQIIIRVLAAVQHAHQNGVVHRDIKPQNILIDKEGTVKVSDFGIARVANTQTMSQDTETVMGSVYYFSPEQAKGAAVDEKSDLYSVGVVLYEMLTGEVPFTGDTPVAIAMKHLQDVPTPPSEINQAVSPALDFVVLHAMEKRPRHRYATAGDMLRDVRLALEHPDTILAARAEVERREREARSSQRRQARVQKRVLWMRRVLVGVFSLILLALMALAGYVIMERILIARRNTVEVPSVMNIRSAEAIRRLEALDLIPVLAYENFELVTEDYVADQSVVPGTLVAPGEKVTITISRSMYTLRIPNVMNISYSDAVNALSGLGLLSSAVMEDNPALINTVLRQSPEPGTPANMGDTVQLVISAGVVRMPRLIDTLQEDAIQTILAYKMTLVDTREVPVDDPNQIGRVIAQDPEPYRDVRSNSAVTIDVGIPSDTIYSANVTIDLSQMPAQTTLRVEVEDLDGRESATYVESFDTPVDSVSITLFSNMSGDALYNVYYNDVLVHTAPTSFTR